MKKLRTLVSGGAGFIGQHLVKALLQRKHKVKVLDTKAGELEKEAGQNLELTLGSIEDENIVKQTVKDVDVLYHLALAYFGENYRSFEVNLKGTINLLEAARENKVKQFLFTSSETIYGKPRYLPIDEEHPCNPHESLYLEEKLYPIIKSVSEKLCLWYYGVHGLQVTVLRLTGVYENADFIVDKVMIKKAMSGKPIIVRRGEGWEYIHVDDAVQAILLATLNRKAYGKVFNISSPKTFITDQELAKIIVKTIKSTSDIQKTEENPEWVGKFNIDKARKTLGFKPKKGKEHLRQIIKEYVTSTYLHKTNKERSKQ